MMINAVGAWRCTGEDLAPFVRQRKKKYVKTGARITDDYNTLCSYGRGDAGSDLGNGNDDRSGFDLGGQSAAIVQHGCFLRLAVTSCMLKFVRDSNQPDDGVDRDLMICLFTSEASSNEFVRGRLASWPSVAEATVSIGISGH